MEYDENIRLCFQNSDALDLNDKLRDFVFNEQDALVIKFTLEQSSTEFENYIIIQ